MSAPGASVPVAVGRPGRWRVVTVVGTRWETPTARTLHLDLGDPFAFLAGQHVLLCDEVVVGDTLEVRGPIGRWFVWEGDEPIVGVVGGSGAVPLMAMLRQARASGRPDLVRLLVSARRPEDLYYADELPGPESTVVWTREAPPVSARPPGRLCAADLAPLLDGGPERTVFVCGSPSFCDAVTDMLAELAVPASRVRVERFGPSR